MYWGSAIYTMSGKKHPKHYRLSLEEGIPNFNNFWYDYFWQLAIKWPFNIPPQTLSASALPGKNKANVIWIEINRNTSKCIPNIINCDLKKNWQIIIFGANIFDTTCLQMTILVPTSPNVCFCTTWKTPNRRNKIKMQYSVGFVSPGSAKTNNGCGGKLNSLIASCVWNIGVKNYLNLIILLWVTTENVLNVFFSGHGVHMIYITILVKLWQSKNSTPS